VHEYTLEISETYQDGGPIQISFSVDLQYQCVDPDDIGIFYGIPPIGVFPERDTEVEWNLNTIELGDEASNAWCNDFTYTLTAASSNDLDLLLSIDQTSDPGKLVVQPYSSQSTIDESLDGTHWYDLNIMVTNQGVSVDTTFKVVFTYVCFDVTNQVLDLGSFPSAITALKDLGQSFTLPIIDGATDPTNPYCGFDYVLYPVSASDADYLISVDAVNGNLGVSAYSSRSSIDNTDDGTYEYYLVITAKNQANAQLATSFTVTLAYQCFDPSTVTLTTNGFPTEITASRSTQ
jgi:hypothetical protein